MSTYNTKNQIFMTEIEARVISKLETFNKNVVYELKLKVDEDEFNRRMLDKAAANDVGKLFLDVIEIKNDIYNLKEVLNSKADEVDKIQPATEEELIKLQQNKAEKMDLENLKNDLLRLEGIVDQLDEGYSEGESYDEYDDEDSQVEDVISLGEAGSQGKDDDDAEDDEEFFGDDDPAKKLADKAKQLTSMGKMGGTGFDAIKKLGDIESKADELKAKHEEEQKNELKPLSKDDTDKLQAEEKDKNGTSQRKKTIDNNDLKQELKKGEIPDKEHNEKSAVGTTDVDCGETTNSMNMTMNTFKQGNSRVCAIKKQETSKSKRHGLSRMSSKMSISTRRRGGGGRGGADSKEVNELKLNMKMVLEDCRKLKNFEHESEATFRRFESTLVELKKKNDLFISQHNAITKKQDEIELQHQNAMEETEKRTKQVIKIYKDIQKLINDFKTEYSYGFKKIIKAEVDIGVLNNQVKFIKNKIKPKKEEKFDKEELIKEIDGKFDVLYQQVAEMATDQAEFNIRIQKDQENLKEPLHAEITKIREESNMMLRELERTQQNNRDIVLHKMTQSMYEPKD